MGEPQLGPEQQQPVDGAMGGCRKYSANADSLHSQGEVLHPAAAEEEANEVRRDIAMRRRSLLSQDEVLHTVAVQEAIEISTQIAMRRRRRPSVVVTMAHGRSTQTLLSSDASTPGASASASASLASSSFVTPSYPLRPRGDENTADEARVELYDGGIDNTGNGDNDARDTRTRSRSHSGGASIGMDLSSASDQARVGKYLAAFLPRTVLAEVLAADVNQQHCQRPVSKGDQVDMDLCPPHLDAEIDRNWARDRAADQANEACCLNGSLSCSGKSVSPDVSPSVPLPLGPRMWPESTGGILMADVSGFSTLMAALTRSFGSRRRSSDARGEISMGNRRSRHYDPSEQMSLILNHYFGAMVQTVEKHGGDVIKFAGDALICFWPTRNIIESKDVEPGDGDRTTGCVNESAARRRMARCALELVRDLNDYDVMIGAGTNATSTTLSLHIACTMMRCKGLHVGGMNGRLEFLLAGPGIGKLGALLESARRGEIAIGGEMWEAFHAEAKATHDEDISRDWGYAAMPKTFANARAKPVTVEVSSEEATRIVGYRIIQAHDMLPPEQDLSAGEGPIQSLAEFIPWVPKLDHLAFETASSDPRVRAYVPSNVLHYHDHSLANLLSENRTVTVVFCSLPAGTCASFESAQRALSKIQKVLHRYKGLLRQFIEDDKATVAIGVWGCPPISHRDDTSRAVLAALELRDALGPCNIGIATGSCYCGTVGTPERCEYVVIGNAVNLSARLMGLGKKRAELNEAESAANEDVLEKESQRSLRRRRGVFCDDATHDAIFAHEENFEVIEKGRDDFKGIGEQTWHEIEHLGSGEMVQLMPLYGREKEMSKLMDKLNAAVFGGSHTKRKVAATKGIKASLASDNMMPPPFSCVIHGPLGIGKSFLVAHFRRKVIRSKLNFRIVDCLCAEQERNTPWYALQGLVPLLWKQVPRLSKSSMNSIALLEDISVDATPSLYREKVEESRKAFTDNLFGETRMANILGLLVELLSKQMELTRLMIVVDDVHNCDMNSLKFIEKFIELCKEKPSLAFLCTTIRPGAPKEVKEVRNKAEMFIRLSRLGSDALRKLTMTELGIPLSSSFDSRLEIAIEKASAGLPLFASETCRFMRRRQLYAYDEKNGLRLSKNGEITFGETLSSSPEEATQNAVRYLIDDVSPEARVLLKCSSLLPGRFRLLDAIVLSRTMHKTMIDTESGKTTKEAIDEIVANRLWERCSTDRGESHFRFSHDFMSQTVYYSMTLSQRGLLHQAYFVLLENAKYGGGSARNAFSSASLEWMASNAALAFLHDKAALFYFQSALSQHRSFNYVAANASLERAFEHLEVCDGSGNENTREGSGIGLTTRIQMTRLMGLMCCLLDRPLEGKPLLETSLEMSDEKGVLMPADQLPAAIAEEKARQQVHREFALIGSANVCSVYDAMEDSLMTEESRLLVMRECCSAYDQLARVYLQSGEPLRGLYCSLRGLNLAEMVGPSEELAKAYSTYAFVKKSPFYGGLARETAESVGALAPVTAFCAMLYGGMLIGEGMFLESQIALTQAVTVSRAIKDFGTLGLSLSVLGWSMFVNGQYDESYNTAIEMETIGKEMNDPRFLNWGLTSRFKCVIAMGNTDGIRELLPRMTLYMSEYWGSMYNSDKISCVGMLIFMHLFNDDLASVRECMEKYETTVDLVSKPCTQLVEFFGCVGIIEGIIAVCTEDSDPTSSRLQQALDAFDTYAHSYPIFHARCHYLRGKSQLIGDSRGGEAIASFREAVAWAKRFGLTHYPFFPDDMESDVCAVSIEPKEFERIDDARDGIDCVKIIEGYRILLNDLEGDEERGERLLLLSSSCCNNLISVWGEHNTSICNEAQELEGMLLDGPSAIFLNVNLSSKKVAILALGAAEFEAHCKSK